MQFYSTKCCGKQCVFLGLHKVQNLYRSYNLLQALDIQCARPQTKTKHRIILYPGPNFKVVLSTWCSEFTVSVHFTETISSEHSKELANFRSKICLKQWRNNRNLHAHAYLACLSHEILLKISTTFLLLVKQLHENDPRMPMPTTCLVGIFLIKKLEGY